MEQSGPMTQRKNELANKEKDRDIPPFYLFADLSRGGSFREQLMVGMTGDKNKNDYHWK